MEALSTNRGNGIAAMARRIRDVAQQAGEQRAGAAA